MPRLKALAATPAVLAIAAFALSASGQELRLTGPLAPARTGRQLMRAMRFEVAGSPGIRLTTHDAAAALLGGELRYYPFDRLGVGAWVTGGTAFGGGCSSFCAALAAPELSLIPLVGRLRFLEFQPYDVHLFVAPAWVWPSTEASRPSRLAASFGGGVRVFSASFFSTSVDYRALWGSGLGHALTVSLSWWPTARRWDYE